MFYANKQFNYTVYTCISNKLLNSTIYVQGPAEIPDDFEKQL